MKMQYSEKAAVALTAEAIAVEEGIYLYCVADGGERTSLGKIGVAGNEVCTIPYNDICAVVHDCLAEPYRSDDQEVVKAWVMMHQKVVDAAWEMWGTVLPFSFDTIIKGEAQSSAKQNLTEWLRNEYETLKGRMEKVRGKAEYGIQVFWDPRVVAQNLAETNPEFREIADEINSKPRGIAYMYRQKLERLVAREMETKAAECFKDFFSRVRQHTDDVRVGKTRKTEQGLQMIMNLSCLVHRGRYKELGEELEKLNQMEGLSVRFTGPWPPYSFAGSG